MNSHLPAYEAGALPLSYPAAKAARNSLASPSYSLNFKFKGVGVVSYNGPLPLAWPVHIIGYFVGSVNTLKQFTYPFVR